MLTLRLYRNNDADQSFALRARTTERMRERLVELIENERPDLALHIYCGEPTGTLNYCESYHEYEYRANGLDDDPVSPHYEAIRAFIEDAIDACA